jgi:hypothetical protein
MIIIANIKSDKIKNLDKLLEETYPGCKILSSSVIKIEYGSEFKYSKQYKIEKEGLLIFYDE